MAKEELKDVKSLIRKAISCNVITGEDAGFVFDDIVLGKTKQEVEKFLNKNKKILTLVASAVHDAEDSEDEDDDEEGEDVEDDRDSAEEDEEDYSDEDDDDDEYE